MSLPEKLLWVRLRRSDLNFRRQHPIGEYVLDFYCPVAKLAIEVDGAAHDFGERPQRDDRRTSWLKSEGIDALRIPAKDVLRDPDEIADAVIRFCTEAAKPLHHSAPLSGPPSPRAALAGRSEGVTSGYSGTPLAKKLSLKEGMRVWFDGMPESVRNEIALSGMVLSEEVVPTPGIHAAHIFVTERADLGRKLRLLLPLLDRAGMIWVSWPKKASKVPTNITEDVIREVAWPMQLVDVKVCSVDDIWSGLKLVIRKEHRSQAVRGTAETGAR